MKIWSQRNFAGMALFLFFLAALFARSAEISSAKGCNVLLITVDTLRSDRLGCYGNERVKTPHIDQLADKGTLFARAFAHTPTTLPSHANILLGTTPLFHGVHDNANFVVERRFLTLATHLKKDGYATAAFIGAFPLDSRFGLTQGFDVYDDNYGTPGAQEFTYVERKAELVVEQALAWLTAQTGKWLLWVHCFDPHQIYLPPEPFLTQYKDRLYDGEVAYVDFALGKLFSFLREKGFEERTLVVFTGDHGESLGQHGESTHGYFAYNATLRIPLIIASPGIKHSRVEQPVCHVDIFPTVCDILGLEKPPFLQGLSLLPAMDGKKLPQRKIYFESLYPYYSRGWAPQQGYLEAAEKFIDSPIPELYDTARDFDETVNLAEEAKIEKQREKLASLIKDLSKGEGSPARTKIDREAQERLRSLGYLSSPQASTKKSFTPQDDLKVLLPYQNKLMQAMGAYYKGNLDEGVSQLQEIIAERRDFDLAYSYLATLYKEQRKIKEALAVLKEGYDNNPGNFKILSSYGIFLVESGDYDQAVEILKKALALIDYDPEVWNYLGAAFYHKGSFAEALRAYEKALSIDHNYPVVFNNLGSINFSVFLKTKDKADYDRAVAHFKKAIELDPAYPSAYNGLGVALRQAGDLEGAMANWKKAVELKPDYGFALYNLGVAHLLRGEKGLALEYLQKYKDQFYSLLPLREQQRLDELIAKAK